MTQRLDGSGSGAQRAARAAGLLPAALAALIAFAPAPPAAAAEGPRQAARDLDRGIDRLLAHPEGPPGAIAVVRRPSGITIFRGGERTLGGGPPRQRDRMRIASTSKTFSAAAVLTLVDLGLVELDQQIGTLLPNLPAAWHAVTLAQVLSHTGGIPDFSASPAFATAVGASPLHAPAPRELLSYVEDEPLDFPPGTSYAYSNSDNIIIGLIVRELSGRGYPADLRRRILKPLGLNRTDLRRRVQLPRPAMHGYAPDGTDVTEQVAFGGWAWASGGIISTPGNLNRFARAWGGGRLLSAATRAAQLDFRPNSNSSPPGPGQNAAGLGIFRYRTGCGTVFGHTGSILGYTQLIAANRSGRRSVTFSVNSQLEGAALERLREAEEAAVCLALARRAD